MLITLVSLVALGPVQAGQAGPDEHRRPEELEVLRTKTAFPLDENEIEVDVLYSHFEFDEGGSDTFRDFEGSEGRASVEVAYGVSKAVTAEIRIPYVFLDPDDFDEGSGWGDVELDVKGGIPEEWLSLGKTITTAAGVRLTVPTGDEARGLGQAEPEWRLYAAGSAHWAGLAAHLQPFVELEDDRPGQGGLNVALEAAPFTPEVSLLIGFNGLWERGEGTIASVIPGAAYRFRGATSLEVGAGVPIGITDDSEEWGVIVDLQGGF